MAAAASGGSITAVDYGASGAPKCERFLNTAAATSDSQNLKIASIAN